MNPRASDDDRPVVYRALRRTRNYAADAALAAALPELEGPYRAVALDTLLERAHEQALAALIASFRRCDAELQSLIAAHAVALSGAARSCMESERLETRLSAVAFIRGSGAGKLAYLLSDALTRPCRKTAEAAGAALGIVIEQVAARVHPAATTGERRLPDELEFASQALIKALSSWPLHFRGEVIAAAARLIRPMENAVLAQVGETRNRTARAFASLLEASHDPRNIPLAVRMLRATHVRESAAKFIAGADDAAFAGGLLEESWLLADDTVRRSAARVRALPAFERCSERLLQAPTAARGLVRWIAAAGSSAGGKRDWVRRLALAGAPAAARAASWAIIEQTADWTEEVLQLIAHRAEHPLADLAAIEIRRRAGLPIGLPASHDDKLAREAAVAAAVQIPVEPVSETPAAGKPSPAVAESAFDVYWDQHESLTHEQRVAIGQQVARYAEDFYPGMRRRLVDSSPATRRRALAIVRDLELERDFADYIERAAADAERLVRSAGVALLGGLDTPAARRLLRAALDDPDDRVQANAIEALERQHAISLRAQIAGKLASTSSRVRANAVKMLLRMRVREGASHLLAMLQSEQAGDRLSALWVVERMRLSGLVARLETLADSDADARVRRRAQRVRDAVHEAAEVAWGRAGGSKRAVRGEAVR